MIFNIFSLTYSLVVVWSDCRLVKCIISLMHSDWKTFFIEAFFLFRTSVDRRFGGRATLNTFLLMIISMEILVFSLTGMLHYISWKWNMLAKMWILTINKLSCCAWGEKMSKSLRTSYWSTLNQSHSEHRRSSATWPKIFFWKLAILQFLCHIHRPTPKSRAKW